MDINGLVLEGIEMLIRTQCRKEEEMQTIEIKKPCPQMEFGRKAERTPRKPEEVHQVKMIGHRVATTRRVIVVVVKTVITGICRTLDISKNDRCKKEGRSSSQFDKENQRKYGFQRRSSNCNRRSCKTAICASDGKKKVTIHKNAHVQNGQPQVDAGWIKSILKDYQEPLAEKTKVQFSRPSLDRAKFRDKRPSLNVIQGGSPNERSPLAPTYDQRSRKCNEEQAECARHKARKLHKELFKIKGTSL